MRYPDLTVLDRIKSMKRFHLNCGTLYPPLGACLFGVGKPLRRVPIVTHCILVESEDGLLLIDTGMGSDDILRPDRMTQSLLWFGHSARDISETAVAQVAALGYSPSDVRHIALTHFHFDHASGLPDFPQAKVHILWDEYQAVMQPSDLNERLVYRRKHWAQNPRWVVHECVGDQWHGFDCTPNVDLGSTSFRFIPLPGHTRGHAGVALLTEEGWLLHCGDAYTFHGEVDPLNPRPPPYSNSLRRIVNLNYAFRNIGLHSKRLRTLIEVHDTEIQLTNSHDPVEFEKFHRNGAAHPSPLM